MSEVRISVRDREDETVVHLPEDYFGQVELSFRAGVLVNVRKSETTYKRALKAGENRGQSLGVAQGPAKGQSPFSKGTRTNTDEHGLTPTG